MNKVHFPGLNGLRFIAALSVIIGHIELIKSDFGICNFKNIIPFYTNTAGYLGVILFFVLSVMINNVFLFHLDLFGNSPQNYIYKQEIFFTKSL